MWRRGFFFFFVFEFGLFQGRRRKEGHHLSLWGKARRGGRDVFHSLRRQELVRSFFWIAFLSPGLVQCNQSNLLFVFVFFFWSSLFCSSSWLQRYLDALDWQPYEVGGDMASYLSAAFSVLEKNTSVQGLFRISGNVSSVGTLCQKWKAGIVSVIRKV